MKRVDVISILAVMVIAGVILVLVFQPRSGRETYAGEDRTLELFTIMGSVPLTDREVPGRWRTSRGVTADLSAQERERLARLNAHPYLPGVRAAPVEHDVTTYDPDRAYDGINLFNSGHAPEASAMDMGGRVLHTWSFDIADVWPEVPHTLHSEFWRRVHWYDNGDVLVIFEGIGMIKLDKDSNLLWAYRDACHHQAVVTEDGKVYVLTRKAKMIPRLNKTDPVLEDAIDILTPDGKLLERCSILESVENSEYARYLRFATSYADLFHTNSIHVFDGSLAHISPLYEEGNVLVSLLTLNLIGIIDVDERRMVWAERSRRNAGWIEQHDPIALENGRLMVFDNRGYRQKSRVLEFDPFKRAIVWQYVGSSEEPFYSKTCGTNQRLPNGNTLITESDNGRAFEVTPEGEIVWEFYNPFRAGEQSQFIATLFEMRRVGKEHMDWLNEN